MDRFSDEDSLFAGQPNRKMHRHALAALTKHMSNKLNILVL